MRYLSTLVVMFYLLQCRPDDPRRQGVAGSDLLPGAYEVSLSHLYYDTSPNQDKYYTKFSSNRFRLKFQLIQGGYGDFGDIFSIEMGGPPGYIDHQGNVVIEPGFKKDQLPFVYDVTDFRESVATIINVQTDFYNNDCERRMGIRGRCERYCDFIGLDGKIITRRPYFILKPFSEGFAVSSSIKKGKFGYVNLFGEIVIQEIYDSAWDFKNGLALVELNGDRFFINKKGKKVFGKPFSGYTDILGDFSEGLALVGNGSLVGYMNTTGKVVIEPKFSNIGDFSEGLALAETANGEKGFIDKTGKFKIQFKDLYAARSFSNGLAYVRFDDKGGEKRGFINKAGDLFLDLTKSNYDVIGDFSEGLAVVYTKDPNRRMLFIDKTGKVAFDINDINRKIWERFKKH
ncbi:WG repeat-containing protein (plasmid) [Leptospira interrogans serovar Canicola]|uniref:WG repeat-containing protein n=1 Tax=Leptospira interrogans serovar Canicola TaxID=211880 RepID=A0AAP9WHE1_LEPIR|nr:WG repeat-containing protein [Leptospira interrogans]QOI45152.1 WG repeat-containing protein [Leptospira interrogans serovar Canicola]